MGSDLPFQVAGATVMIVARYLHGLRHDVAAGVASAPPLVKCRTPIVAKEVTIPRRANPLCEPDRLDVLFTIAGQQ